jgi:L-proline amide hydrolase
MRQQQVREGYSSFGEYRTWYRITGDLSSGRLPLIVVHGGPDCTHDYVDNYRGLADDGRAVVHHDQLGNGRSNHLPDRGPDFWIVQLFLDEMEALLSHLGIAQGYALLGQSWGGMLSAEHAVRRPGGLRALVIANSPSSMKVWVEKANRLRRELPAEVQESLLRHETADTLDHPDYLAASRVFYDRNVCRVSRWPPEVARTSGAIEEDPTVYRAMNGPTEFHVIGALRDWTIVDRLGQSTVPTRAISGRCDEATPLVVQPYADKIPDVRWRIFENSSHMPHVEEKDACLAEISAFLGRIDRSTA